MKLNHRRHQAIDIVEMCGRLVMADTPEVRQQLRAIIEQGSGKLVLDLAGVRFVDSSGLSVLVAAFKLARSKGGDVVLLRLTPAVRSLIELTRMQDVFTIVDDEAAAIDRLS